MSPVKIRLSLPSPALLGHLLIYCGILDGLGAARLARLWGHSSPTSLHPQALPKADKGEEK